jgi:hypothetical protein
MTTPTPQLPPKRRRPAALGAAIVGAIVLLPALAIGAYLLALSSIGPEGTEPKLHSEGVALGLLAVLLILGLGSGAGAVLGAIVGAVRRSMGKSVSR